ncbi:unnamed protein product [Onchocerca ochengi]|uniref:Zinc finger CCCH domain-containing protein 14 n=1 Tax=Onchocerca ochengi TaxID=42157 RepID=A0A182E3U6_ONCOC|nr:unnamed protein product [Onchocerca ochengi]
MSYRHGFRQGRSGLVDLTQNETILPLKITVGCDALPPPPPPPPLPLPPPLPSLPSSSTSSILPEPLSLQLTTSNPFITGSYWRDAQSFYEPITTIMNEIRYCEPLYASNVGMFRNNDVNQMTQSHSGSRTSFNYIRLIDSPPPPPELGMPIKQTAMSLQITNFKKDSDDVQHTEKDIIQNNHQVIQSDILSGQWTKFTAGLEKEETISNESNLTMRSQFKGKVFKLPENCGRPQSSEGRTFPLKIRNDDMNYDSSDYNEPQYEKDSHRDSPDSSLKLISSMKHSSPIDQAPAVIRTATKIVRKVVPPMQKILVPNMDITDTGNSSSASGHPNTLVTASKIAKLTKPVSSNGTMSKNGMSWRRRQTNEDLEVEDEVPANKLYTQTSHECFEFAEHGHCEAGAFCPFNHNGDSTHRMAKICSKLMTGSCRGRCGQAHCLSSHQMPICDYFLRRTCSDEHCPYLHVKHTVGSKPCEDFNRGICKKGSSCSSPHRYYYSVIKKKCDRLEMSSVSQVLSRHGETNKSEESDEECDIDEKSTLQWIL